MCVSEHVVVPYDAAYTSIKDNSQRKLTFTENSFSRINSVIEKS